jgi:TIR domain/WD domain, G-beta repeat
VSVRQKFKFDVFLSHSSKDKLLVRQIAKRLREAGAKVWFDEWELRPGDNIQIKIEEGLELSRVLLLCMSAHAFGSDWALLEAGTFRFRDPLNKERRFVPLKLDNSHIRGSLTRFLYIDWLAQDREQTYAKLFEACLPPAKPNARRKRIEHGRTPVRTTKLKPTQSLRAYSFSLDLNRVLTGGTDGSVQLWDLTTGRCLREFRGHKNIVWNLAWSPDERRALSADSHGLGMRLWSVETGRCLRLLRHPGSIEAIASHPHQLQALSGGRDGVLRL